MRLHYVTRKHVSHVELMKEGKFPVGIVPKGAVKHGRPVVKSIQFKSIAHRSHCVGIGDVILTVCGQDSSGMGKRDIRRQLHNTQRVDLDLEYEIREPCLSTSGIYCFERVSVNVKKTLDSFGFILRKHTKKNAVCTEYPIISNITQNGPVDKEVFLRAGDRLIRIDDEDLSWMSLKAISDILEEKEEATFLVEYSVRINDTCIRPGERTELEIERLDADLGIVLASSSKDQSSTFIERIQKGSLAERCGVFHVGDVVLCINDISTAHLSASDANALVQSFKKRPGKLIFVKNIRRFQLKPEISSNTFVSEPNANGRGALHPLLHNLVSGGPGHLIPPQNSPASLYNWHFKRTHSTLAKTDRKSFDFQSKTISLLRDVILNISTLQQLIPSPDCHLKRNCKIPHHHTCHPDAAYDTNRLSQLDAMCTETKDSARTIAMHFVKNTINVSLLNDTSGKPLDGTCGSTGDNSYFTRSKMIQELTENLTEIYTKKFISKHALDRFLGNVSAVDFDCYECYQLCLSAALTVQKVMLLLSLNDPDLDAMFVINTLIMSVVQVDVPCEDCRTPWCSVSEIGKTAFCVEEEDNPCDLLCRSENIQSPATDPFYLSLMHHAGLSGSRDSLNGSKDNISRTFNRTYSKRSGVNLNMAKRSAFYSLAQIQADLPSTASEREIVCGLQPEKILINTQNMHPGSHSCNSQISHIFTELPKVPNNSPSDSKKSERRQLAERRTIIAENYTHNCQEKIHVDKDLLSTHKQEWKSEEAISKSKSKNTLSTKLKSVITKHASDPSGFVKNLQKPMDIFKSCKTSPRAKTPATDVTDCIRSQSTSSNNAESRLSLDTLGSIKSHSSTMEVNLRNEGKGFGLEIGFVVSTEESPMMPVIVDVEPDSAAAKIGVLLKGDRIASINGESAVGLTVDEFTNLTKVAFEREEVSLTVDFDVSLPEVRFGTFDIHFDKDLKTGLEFKDFSKGSPLVVKGVVKGSAAHRSGQLFAGDEILFTNCIRQEAFDSRRCSYRRTEMVLMTVRREHSRDSSDSEFNQIPRLEASDSPQYSPTSSSCVEACAVQRTSIHTVSGSSALVLEQQISLRRDPRLKDFGFLVGQNQMTGGVYVTGIRPGGPADRSKVVKKNDRIMEIDGTPVGNKESSSLSLLLQAGDLLELVTRRVLSCKE